MSKARDIADLGSNDVLETTATGVDVTGTVTADGLTVENTGVIAASFNGGSAATYVRWSDSTDNWFIGTNTGLGGMLFKNETADANRFFIGSNGNVQFYEDTGTTAKMVWDASAESLGIGTSSPTNKLSISTSTYANSYVPIQDLKYSTYDVLKFGYTASGGGIRTGTIDTSTYGFAVNTGNGTERMRIDSAGNVGIGDTAPERKLHVNSGSTNECALFESTDTEVTLALKDSTGTAEIRARNDFRFYTGGSESARLDSSGNLLVGKTSTLIAVDGTYIGANGVVEMVTDGSAPLRLNRKTNDGEIIQLRKDGSTVGSIGTTTAGNFAFYSPSEAGIETAAVGILPMMSGVRSDNQADLGYSSSRWDDVYATNGTINTSDRNEKQDIESISDAERLVAQACKGLLRKFRWKDSVAEKGDDARIHFGIIAQDLQDAFTAEGLDAGRYAMFISSTWTDEETGEERTRLGVRYPELLAFIISAL